jgi:oxygen-independent coproporphyrinogen-3 oxidase
VGLDASSALRAANSATNAECRIAPGPVLRTTSTCDLKAYLAGTGIVEAEWLCAARQHEEAWFLGLRMNAGVNTAALQQEFGNEMVEAAMKKAARMAEDGLLAVADGRVRLTARGRLLSNEVFQEFVET